MKTGNNPGRRIVIVSNRLPFTVEQENGEITFNQSAGGVATGLKSLLDTMPGVFSFKLEYLWVVRLRRDFSCAPLRRYCSF